MISKHVKKLTKQEGGILMKNHPLKTGYPSHDRAHLFGVSKKKINPKVVSLCMLSMFKKINFGHMDETAICIRGKKYSKKRLLSDSLRFAEYLSKLIATRRHAQHLYKKDIFSPKIAIVTQSCYEGIVATLGANAVGVAVVMISSSCEDSQLVEELYLHKPLALIAYGKSANWANKIQGKVQSHFFLQKIWIINAPDSITEEIFGFNKNILENSSKNRGLTLKSIFNYSRDKNEAVIFLKSSGYMTGGEKSLPFSNHAICAALKYTLISTKIKPHDQEIECVLCTTPYHLASGWMPMFLNIIAGNKVVITGTENQEIADYYKYHPSYIYATPIVLEKFIMKTPITENLSYLKAFYCGGAVLSEMKYRRSIDFLREHKSNAEIRNNYSVSEALGIGTFTENSPHLPETIGRLYLGPKWLIVDENLNEVKYNEPGELLMSSETLCLGYFNDEKATQESFIDIDGDIYFRTGDIVSLHESGYVTFLDRKQRFFSVEGYFKEVNCNEIEQGLENCECVKEAAVIVANYGSEKRAKAFIVLRHDDGKTNYKKLIRKELKKFLLGYQMPSEIQLVNKLPIMESGKVNYSLLETNY